MWIRCKGLKYRHDTSFHEHKQLVFHQLPRRQILEDMLRSQTPVDLLLVFGLYLQGMESLREQLLHNNFR